MTKPSIQHCIKTALAWHYTLTESYDKNVSVDTFKKLMNAYNDDVKSLFPQMSWEEQITITVATDDPRWINMLDTEQLSAYQLMKD